MQNIFYGIKKVTMKFFRNLLTLFCYKGVTQYFLGVIKMTAMNLTVSIKENGTNKYSYHTNMIFELHIV